MADPYESVTVTNYNANPPADDGTVTEANRVKWSTIKTKLDDPLKTAIEEVNTNLVTAFGKIDGGITSTAVNYVVQASDQGKLVRTTVNGVILTTPDAASVGAPFVFGFLNDTTADLLIDGSGSQTIDGDATITVPAGTGGRLRTDGTNWFTEGQNFQSVILNLLTGYLSGLTLSAAGSTATFVMAAGVAMDVDGGGIMNAGTIAKTTSAWTVGSAVGSLDTGTIANNTWYHVYIIKRVDTGVVDVLVSLSASAPTMPANYTLKRRIGSMKTDGSGQWTKFYQNGDTFLWSVPVIDANSIATGTTRQPRTLTVPTGVVVTAMFRIRLSASGGSCVTVLTSLQEADTAIGQGVADINVQDTQTSDGDFQRITDTSARIGIKSSTTFGLIGIGTYGWVDTRGK